MFDELERAVKKANCFVEVRVLRGVSTKVKTRNDVVESADVGFATELGVRALYQGSWGFSASHNLTKLDECIKKAEKLARVLIPVSYTHLTLPTKA